MPMARSRATGRFETTRQLELFGNFEQFRTAREAPCPGRYVKPKKEAWLPWGRCGAWVLRGGEKHNCEAS